jgi:hypothetical protein
MDVDEPVPMQVETPHFDFGVEELPQPMETDPPVFGQHDPRHDFVLRGKNYQDSPTKGSVLSRGTGNPKDDMFLQKAYEREDGLYRQGNTLYIAGTKSFGDMRDDLLIPFHQTYRSQRWQDASKYVKEHTGVTTLVGHSLGGSVALDLQQHMMRTHHRPMESRVYGTPAVSMGGEGNVQRYRHPLDPISIFDRGAKLVPTTGLNPHSTSGFGK